MSPFDDIPGSEAFAKGYVLGGLEREVRVLQDQVANLSAMLANLMIEVETLKGQNADANRSAWGSPQR